MRVTTLVIAGSLVLGCGGKKDEGRGKQPDKGSDTTQGKVAEAPPPQVKKPVETKPLPELQADPGGATGKALWATGFGGLGIDSPRGIGVTSAGEVYVAGYFDAEIDFGGTIGKKAPVAGADPKKKPSDAYLAKVGADGKVAWVQTFGAARDDSANDVAVKGDKVIVVGNFLDSLKLGEFTKKSAGSDDAFVAQFDAKGEIQWLWNFGGIDSDGANAVAAMPDGGWVVGGSFSGSADFGTTTLKSRGGTDAMLLKLAPSGDLEWVKQFGGAYQDLISHVAVDGQGNIYVQGQFKDLSDWGGKDRLKAGGGSDLDVVLAKYDLNGDHVWSKRFGNAFNDVAGGVTVDPAGHVTMVGSFDKSASFGEGDDHTSLGESDLFVARFTPSGKLQWAKTMGAEREDIASGVGADAAGNVVVSGWFQGSVDFGKGPITSKGNKDIFALKLDAKGATVWAQSFGDKDHDQGRVCAVDEKGAAYIAGIYRFALSAVEPPLQSVRAEGDRIPKPDTFVLKLDR
ncbi:MAG: SBBP repeat-containing protein [Myxococcales bacterium]|nr:SBBP repeat-containing protein [Myxococcales bacterium]